MYKLTLWLIIAFVGLLLYVYPSFVTRRMYEGFVTESSLPETPITTPPTPTPTPESLLIAQATPIEPSPNSTAGPSPDIDTLMRNIQDVMRVQTYTPDLGHVPTMTMVAAPTPTESIGNVPSEASTTTSQPATSINDASNKSLEQGVSFQKTLPKCAQEPVEPVPKSQSVDCPRANCPRVKCPRVDCPKQKCPAPVCPDMREYIRKDSIPCWGCKL
jgi:hypothetical protein